MILDKKTYLLFLLVNSCNLINSSASKDSSHTNPANTSIIQSQAQPASKASISANYLLLVSSSKSDQTLQAMLKSAAALWGKKPATALYLKSKGGRRHSSGSGEEGESVSKSRSGGGEDVTYGTNYLLPYVEMPSSAYTQVPTSFSVGDVAATQAILKEMGQAAAATASAAGKIPELKLSDASKFLVDSKSASVAKLSLRELGVDNDGSLYVARVDNLNETVLPQSQHSVVVAIAASEPHGFEAIGAMSADTVVQSTIGKTPCQIQKFSSSDAGLWLFSITKTDGK